MLSFASDYIAGAHPEIMKRLMETNLEVLSGYGSDIYSLRAAEKIRNACGCPEAEVYFLVGGTQTNQLVISSMLENYEGVIAAETGHVSVHEAGAIEYTGHKVIALAGENARLSADTLEKYMVRFNADENRDHMVTPGMVYISQPTEYGTIYSKAELSALYEVCRKNDLTLYIDGARLGYALASPACDMTLKELAGLCDVFYIGGTKVGALCGEALVFSGTKAPRHFISHIKQHGALLAKGRLAGVQFDALFTDGLYKRVSAHAIDMAGKLKELFASKGYEFFIDSPTNQQFFILDNDKLNELKKNVEFSFWDTYDDTHTVVRFAVSWSTTDEDIRQLAELL